MIDALGSPALGTRAPEGDPGDHAQAGAARDRDALPRGPLLRPQALQGRGRRDLGPSRLARLPHRTARPSAARAQRALDLSPWVDAETPARPCRPLAGRRRGIHARAACASRSSTSARPIRPRTSSWSCPRKGVVFSGDILFTGRVPFVGQADSKAWLARIGRLIDLKPTLMVTGHGEVSARPVEGPGAYPRLPHVPAHRNGRGRGRLRAVRGGVPANRLEPLRSSAGLRGRQPRQRLRHLSPAWNASRWRK